MAQSFFDKLTGTLKVKEESASSQNVAQPIAAKPKIVVQPAPIIQETAPIQEPEKATPEISHSEVEGQLTVDVYQTPDEIVVRSTIAGVTIDDLDISITDDTVTIRGERKSDEDVAAEDYFHQECYWGPFSRSIILPVDVDSEKAAAAFKKGILTIRLPKKTSKKAKTKKIKIAEE